MAKNATIFFTQEGHSADANAVVGVATVGTVGGEGGRLLKFRSRGILAQTVEIIVDEGSGDIIIAQETNVIDGQDLLDSLPKDKNGNGYANLPPNTDIRVKTSAGNLDVSVYWEDY